ncbi:MAG TPA: D-glycero-beta-D-manno-heptose 1-phosphate adenylyltransferase [Planctomycetes bacterium]|nr:D-glycero-beta-D-manno-heptose 1-phosphate adenylyltransferase [Planctomycetota bacterium]
MIPELETLGDVRILVAGDLMLDEYFYGDVERVSPEAPVPVVKEKHHEKRVGGAGSVVTNLRALGADVVVVGLVGDDDSGRDVLAALESADANVDGVVVSCSARTIRKTRVLAGVQHAGRAQQQILRLDREQIRPLDETEQAAVLGAIETAFDTDPAAVLISDYEKGLLGQEVLRSLIERARSRSIPVLVDPGRSGNWSGYRGAHLICPNRFEASGASGIDFDEAVEKQLEAGELLLDRFDLDHCILTLDRDGITRVSRQGDHRRHPTRVRAVTDVAGAGDMVLTLLGLAVAAGWDIDEACQLANLGAGIEVQKTGVQSVELWELQAARDSLERGSPDLTRTREEMIQIVSTLKADGQVVVFTNGCFDLLHAGHLQLIETARAFGDTLVVGINSDASVSRLKGPERPFLPATERARLLGALACVDHVVVFDQDTPEAILSELLPDVLVKGADYKIDEVVGREVVEAAGGRVELVTLKPGASTTGLIERIRRGARTCPPTPDG